MNKSWTLDLSPSPTLGGGGGIWFFMKKYNFIKLLHHNIPPFFQQMNFDDFIILIWRAVLIVTSHNILLMLSMLQLIFRNHSCKRYRICNRVSMFKFCVLLIYYRKTIRLTFVSPFLVFFTERAFEGKRYLWYCLTIFIDYAGEC